MADSSHLPVSASSNAIVNALSIPHTDTNINPAADASALIQNLEYFFASNANVSDFVTTKLYGSHNYNLWKTQMLCLMKCHNMVSLVDGTLNAPTDSSKVNRVDQYISLLKGWIFGTISEDLFIHVTDLNSVKEIWGKLQSLYDPSITSETDPVPRKPKAQPESKDTTRRNKRLCRATMEGHWCEVETILIHYPNAARDVIGDGRTILHIAVGTSHRYFVKKLIYFIKDTEILKTRSLDGSTALHIAAIAGNTYAAGLLIQREECLMKMKDRYGHIPFITAYLHKQFDTSVFLFKATHVNGKTEKWRYTEAKIAHNLLLGVISTKQYDLALELLKAFPDLAVKHNAEVLNALDKNFPSGLNYVEERIYPSLGDIREKIVNKTRWLFSLAGYFYSGAISKPVKSVLSEIIMILLVLSMTPIVVYRLISFVVWIVFLSFEMLYFLLWKVTARLPVQPIKRIEKKKEELEKAKEVLIKVCDIIDESESIATYHSLYRRPILEAACHNAYEVVAEILSRSPEAIRCKDRSGYNIFHLAVIHRSERIYNLIYDTMDHRSLYKTRIDSSQNNILHLAGRLAPSHKHTTNAALQLQQELQLRKEMEKLVLPALMHQENIFKETPDMVFTKEHENLVKEGEIWMKTTAESCSIIAALITTIVFAAAITIPGESNQETGIPLFTKEAAFITFAVSDAISLCASTTSLLMFLSILTSRFAEQDFVVRLPRRLIIGLCSLLISTTAMMVAFGATFFLVFSHHKAWMIAPICGTVCLPIAIFAILQFPLILDLSSSTYVPIFGKRSKGHHSRYNLDDKLLMFSEKLHTYCRNTPEKEGK